MRNKPGKPISKADALAKLQKYCAFQERSVREVQSKLYELGVFKNDQDAIIASLEEDNFLNEERFAGSFARGKFLIKGWGRNRIRQELKMKGISDGCINKAMKEIVQPAYEQTLETMLARRKELLREEDAYKLKNKLAQYAMRLGYESDLIWKILGEIMTDTSEE